MSKRLYRSPKICNFFYSICIKFIVTQHFFRSSFFRPGGRATKPGDVVTARNGKTICIDNTDAEGRLVLCDAIDYATECKPTFILDVATLTGACSVALGDCLSGAYCNNNEVCTT